MIYSPSQGNKSAKINEGGLSLTKFKTYLASFSCKFNLGKLCKVFCKNKSQCQLAYGDTTSKICQVPLYSYKD